MGLTQSWFGRNVQFFATLGIGLPLGSDCVSNSFRPTEWEATFMPAETLQS